MNNLNSILIEGDLVADPTLSYEKAGTACCAFEVAVVRQVKVGEEVERQERFFTVRTTSRLAEVCAEYLKKGRGVRVVGRLDAEPSGKGQLVFVAAEHVEFKPAMTAGEREAAAGVTQQG